MSGRKHLLLVAVNADSSVTGFAVRVITIARTLLKSNYDVTILKLYPIMRSQGRWRRDRSLADLNVIEMPVLPLSRYPFLRWVSVRIANCFIYLIAMLKNTAAIQAETPTAGFAALVYRWAKIPVVVDYHGAAPEEARHRNRYSGLENDGPAWLEGAERLCISSASATLYVSPKMYEHLLEKYQLSEIANAYLVPVNVEDSFFVESDRRQMRKMLGIGEQEILLVYSGGAQEYQCIEEMGKTFGELYSISSLFRLLIITRDVEKVKRLFRGVVPDRAEVIYRSVSKEEVPSLLSAADLAFLLRKKELLNVVSCPTKFGEYLARGVPVITTEWAGHAPVLVSRHGLGIVVDVENIDVKKIIQFSTGLTQELRDKCVTVARDSMSWRVSEAALLSCYSALRLE